MDPVEQRIQRQEAAEERRNDPAAMREFEQQRDAFLAGGFSYKNAIEFAAIGVGISAGDIVVTRRRPRSTGNTSS